MAGDAETGVTIHRTVKELDAGPIAAQRAFPIGEQDDAGAVYAEGGRARRRAARRVLPEPEFTPQAEDGVTYAEKITAADRELDWTRPAEELVNHVRALSPHIGARAELHGRPVTVWKARVARRQARAARGAAGRQAPHDVRRVPARPAMTCALRRRTRSSCACSRTTRTPTACFAAAATGLDCARPCARAAARVRNRAARPHARPRDRDARQASGAQARPAGAGCAAARRVPARLHRRPAHAAVNETVELVRAARLERAVAFTNAVMRRLVARASSRCSRRCRRTRRRTRR